MFQLGDSKEIGTKLINTQDILVPPVIKKPALLISVKKSQDINQISINGAMVDITITMKRKDVNLAEMNSNRKTNPNVLAVE